MHFMQAIVDVHLMRCLVSALEIGVLMVVYHPPYPYLIPSEPQGAHPASNSHLQESDCENLWLYISKN